MQQTDNQFHSRSILSNILWKFLERGSAVVVTLLVNIVLARLLPPSVHGLLAMVTVFVAISEIFVTAGLGNALIQKKDADALDFSTIFWLNLIVSGCLYLVLFFAAPTVSHYYGYPELTPLLRVLSLRLVISAVNSIQCAFISRNMMFRHYFYSTLSGKTLSGIIGVALAYAGAGVWALVAQSVTLTLIETLVLWFRVQWRPSLRFSWQRGKKLYQFACRVMFTSFIETISDHVRSLLIGKNYSASDLAYYNKGMLFPSSITTNVTSALSAVMFPVLSNRQDDPLLLKETCRQWIRLFAYCMFPLLAGLSATAGLWVPLLLTEKWRPAVPFLQLICGVYAAWVIEVPIRETIKSAGRADVCLNMQIIKALCSLGVLLLVKHLGVFVIALSALACSIFNAFVSAFFAKKHFAYTPLELCSDLWRTVLLCAAIAAVSYLVKLYLHEGLVCFALQLLASFVVYGGLSVLTGNRELHYCLDLVKSLKTAK